MPAVAKLALQRIKGAPERTPDSAGEQQPVEEAGDTAAWLVLDDEPVDESLAVRLEVALMPRVGQSRLLAGVGDEPVRLERGDRHGQLAFAPQQPRNQPGRVPRGAPARILLEAHVTGPNFDQFAVFVMKAKPRSTGTS